MSKRLLVVEPHSDDAFLSLGATIEATVKSGVPVTILTLFPEKATYREKRNEEARAYAEAVGADWVGLSWLGKGAPLPTPSRELRQLVSSSQLILPLAILHPDHIQARAYFDSQWPRAGAWYYLDQPYAIALKNDDAIARLIEGRRVVSYRYPGVRKFRHISIFKSQAKFFYFNPLEKLLRTSEVLVR